MIIQFLNVLVLTLLMHCGLLHGMEEQHEQLLPDHLIHPYGWQKEYREQKKEEATTTPTRYYRLFRIDPSRIVAGTCNNDLEVWEAKTKTLEKTIATGIKGYLTALAYNKNDILAVASAQEEIKILDLPTGKCLHTISVKDGVFGPLKFISPTRLASLTGKVFQQITIFDSETGDALQTLTQDGINNPKWIITFLCLKDKSSEDQIFIAATYKPLVLWDSRDFYKAQQLSDNNDIITSLILLKNKQIFVSGSWYATLKLWDLDGRCLKTFEKHDGAIIALVALDNETVASASYSNKTKNKQAINIWDLNTGECKKTLISPEAVSGLKKINATTLVSESKSDVTIWDILTGESVQTFKSFDDTPYDTAIVMPGEILIINKGTTLEFIDWSKINHEKEQPSSCLIS